MYSFLERIHKDLEFYEEQYVFEEYEINTIDYRLMANERYEEAAAILDFNISRYPDSWNVYDSMGELQLKMGNTEAAEKFYQKSLALNSENVSALNALKSLDK